MWELIIKWISFRPIGNIWVQNLWNFNKKKNALDEVCFDLYRQGPGERTASS